MLTAVVAVVAVGWQLRGAVRVRVGGLRGGAGVLGSAQCLLARCGVRVAGCHQGRRDGLLRCGEDLEQRWRKYLE